MTTNDSLLVAKDQVNVFIEEFVDKKVTLAKEYDPQYERLWKEIREYLFKGGKRMRPYLMLLAYRSYGGKAADTVLPVAAGWEFLHASLLVHDDIIDRDDTRHGALNITGSYKNIYRNVQDKTHFAASAALLAGDLLLSSAHETISYSSLSSDDKTKAHQLFSQALFGVAGGELLDTEMVFTDIDKVDALKIAHYKTAEYTCEYPLVCGAMLAGAHEKELEKIRKLAYNIGIGYQLVDDLLGVFGVEEVTGKTIKGDIRERKRTLLIQFTHKLLTGSNRVELENLYNSQGVLSDSEVEIVRNLIDISGAKAQVESQISRYASHSYKIIKTLDIAESCREEYRQLVEKLLRREK